MVVSEQIIDAKKFYERFFSLSLGRIIGYIVLLLVGMRVSATIFYYLTINTTLAKELANAGGSSSVGPETLLMLIFNPLTILGFFLLHFIIILVLVLIIFLSLKGFKSNLGFVNIFKTVLVYISLPICLMLISNIINIIFLLIFGNFSIISNMIAILLGYVLFLLLVMNKVWEMDNILTIRKLICSFILPFLLLFFFFLVYLLIHFIFVDIVYYYSLGYATGWVEDLGPLNFVYDWVRGWFR